jgi:undecaprenyl-diphosphatase
MDLFKTIFLGIIEGLTEFIPVSSTAHLLIASKIIDFQSVKNNLFEIFIQIGAIFAVCIIYRKKIFDILLNLTQKKQQKFSINLALAFLPAVFFGVLFHDFIKEFLFSTFVIAISLIIGGLIMIFIDYKPRKFEVDAIENITFIKAFYIGLFQCLAMIPGISRSGATIIGGILLKLDRKTATEFSFFLAIPTIFAATIYDLVKNISTLTFSNVELLLIGTLSAFISAIFVIKWFLNYVSKNNFVIFGIYRIIIGVIILIFII